MMLALGLGSGRYVVGCEPYKVELEGSNVLIEIGSSRVQAIEVAGVSARSLVVPVRNPNVLVYPQPAAPVPTLIRRRKAAPRLVALDPLGIEKGSKCSVTEVGTNQNIIY